jgi:hypothetical protein
LVDEHHAVFDVGLKFSIRNEGLVTGSVYEWLTKVNQVNEAIEMHSKLEDDGDNQTPMED